MSHTTFINTIIHGAPWLVHIKINFYDFWSVPVILHYILLLKVLWYHSICPYIWLWYDKLILSLKLRFVSLLNIIHVIICFSWLRHITNNVDNFWMFRVQEYMKKNWQSQKSYMFCNEEKCSKMSQLLKS